MNDAFGHRRHTIAIVLAVVLGTGPTVGDIGSCGQQADDLDAPTFFDLKANIDCGRCDDCGLRSQACDRACNDAPPTAFASGCRPLVHDGEVCLRALIHASCDDYQSFMNDSRPSAPGECQFCPAR